jgi:hypothetical protein
VIWRQQEVADDIRDPHDQKSDEQAEQSLAQQRRPVECEERADAAESKRRPSGHQSGSDTMTCL